MINKAKQLSEPESRPQDRYRKTTPRQRTFVSAYLTTGCAAKAARAAGYDGQYAAQAGYKLLRKRKGTKEHFERTIRLERLVLRRNVRRALRCIDRLVEPKDVPLRALERVVGPLVEALRAIGLSDDPACRALVKRLELKPPNWRRLYRLPWERPTESGVGKLDLKIVA